MKRIQIILEALSLLVAGVLCAQAESGETPTKPAVQIEVERIQQMQNQPDDFHVPDWKKITDGFTDLAFDLGAKGEYMPLVWIDTNHINYPEDAFGQFVVVGDPRGGPKMANGTYYIASGSIAAVISATLVGYDMTNYKGRNWVQMCLAFFNKANGRNVFMEHVKEFDGQSVGGCYDFDFWGDVLPSQLAIELSSLYPREHEFDEPLKLTADRFTDAVGILLSTPEKFAWSTFDWKTMKPVKNFIPGERDAAGGMGAFLYLAYQRFGDLKYLDASFRCLDYLESLDKNPIYSCMIAYGPLAMAKANAEHGKNYDVTRQLKWCFEGGAVCVEGVHAGKWGDYEMSGLVEMQGCKRVYAMETFLWAKQLVPLPRYDARFARVIGKWMMNAASNARYFYPDYLPKTNQVAPEYAKLTRGVIGTEAITAKSMYGDRPIPTAETDKWETKNPDGTPSVRPLASNYSLYGSSHVGIYGGIIHRISSDTGETIALDCLKTDFLHAKAYPTWLVYNPTFKEQRLKMPVGSETVDIYDTVTHSYLKRNVSGIVKIPLPADSAAVLVYVPSGCNETHDGSRLLVNGVVVDWNS